jgi:hypothetical protein
MPPPEVVCGLKQYTATTIYAAAEAACKLLRSGSSVGSSTYPHRYNDREGFTFAGVAGPYYEFPLLSNGKIYRGGLLGPNREIYIP